MGSVDIAVIRLLTGLTRVNPVEMTNSNAF